MLSPRMDSIWLSSSIWTKCVVNNATNTVCIITLLSRLEHSTRSRYGLTSNKEQLRIWVCCTNQDTNICWWEACIHCRTESRKYWAELHECNFAAVSSLVEDNKALMKGFNRFQEQRSKLLAWRRTGTRIILIRWGWGCSITVDLRARSISWEPIIGDGWPSALNGLPSVYASRLPSFNVPRLLPVNASRLLPVYASWLSSLNAGTVWSRGHGQ